MSSNGHNGNGHSNGGDNGAGGKAHEALSAAQTELLRQALREHGKRIGELEAKMDDAMNEYLTTREIVAKIHERVRKIAEKLGIDPDDI